MSIRRSVILSLLALWPSVALAYDDTWYRLPAWPGEYPHGFTMSADTSVGIRPVPEPGAERNVPCQLRKDATYHPWNAARVRSDGLEFVSFTRIEEYRLNEDHETYAQTADEATIDMVFDLKKGDRWSYLTYLGEGAFLMRLRGVIYVAGQDLIEVSSPVSGAADAATDEWVKLTCADGATGWLLLGEVVETPGFGPPNILGYGEAADGPAS